MQQTTFQHYGVIDLHSNTNFNKSSTAKHPRYMGGVHRYKRLKYLGLYEVYNTAVVFRVSNKCH
jgi:hypothetical protein